MPNILGTGGVTFKTLWDNYPAFSDPCDGPFTNQCAIRFTHALMEQGLKLKGFRGTKCWGDKKDTNHKHAIRAEDVGNWLAGVPYGGMGRREKIDPAEYQKTLDGRTGFVFFKDYWQRSLPSGKLQSFANRSGDHIDLWNGSHCSGDGSMALREDAEDSGDLSDRNKAKQIWFWEVK
ncbi:type VI secretion system amidase effector protein Tae4 [Vannielia sp. SX4]|uniref:type VI secretion system amidase effector protein Tae4 n=1 Tax=Vannielia sp. SX4 TaxID=3463852 RepID=UPI004059959B